MRPSRKAVEADEARLAILECGSTSCGHAMLVAAAECDMSLVNRKGGSKAREFINVSLS